MFMKIIEALERRFGNWAMVVLGLIGAVCAGIGVLCFTLANATTIWLALLGILGMVLIAIGALTVVVAVILGTLTMINELIEGFDGSDATKVCMWGCVIALIVSGIGLIIGGKDLFMTDMFVIRPFVLSGVLLMMSVLGLYIDKKSGCIYTRNIDKGYTVFLWIVGILCTIIFVPIISELSSSLIYDSYWHENTDYGISKFIMHIITAPSVVLCLRQWCTFCTEVEFESDWLHLLLKVVLFVVYTAAAMAISFCFSAIIGGALIVVIVYFCILKPTGLMVDVFATPTDEEKAREAVEMHQISICSRNAAKYIVDHPYEFDGIAVRDAQDRLEELGESDK